MTIRASHSTPRPVALPGSKAAAPAAEAETPVATARDAARDRLVLSQQATQPTEATADSLNEAELARIQGTGTKPEATTPEAKQPESKQPESKTEATAPEAKLPESKQPESKAEATTPEAKQPETKQPESKTEVTTPEAKQPEVKTETAAHTTQSQTTNPETKTDAVTSQTRTGEAQKKPETQKKLLSSHAPYYSEKKHFEQVAPLIETALAGQTVSFKNLHGTSVEAAITKEANSADGHEQYRVKVGTDSFNVVIAPEQDSKALLAKVVEYYSRFPEHLRGNVKNIALEIQQNPEDAYWAKTYNNPAFSSAASAGLGLITFWHLKENPLNLSEDTFNHEMGHLVGEALKRKGPNFATRVPEGWQEAAKADDDKVSNYAGMNPDEDFAETWSFYLYSRTDAKAMEALRERVPNRLKILDALYEKFEGPSPAPAPAAETPVKAEGAGNG